MSLDNYENHQSQIAIAEEVHTVAEAVAHIEVVKNKLAAYGNNDSEFEVLGYIKKQLESGHISPTEAVQQADELFESKILR